MIRIPSLFLLLAGLPLVAADTTNAPPADAVAASPLVEAGQVLEPEAPAPAAPEPFETHIYSDTWTVGIKSRTAVYRGNVRLDDPRLQLTCEQLTADVPEGGDRLKNAIAETNVVIVMVDDSGKTNRAFADKAIYTYTVTENGTNETVELSGTTQPRIELEKVIVFGDVIVWDRVKDEISAVNQRMIPRPDPVDAETAPDTNGVDSAGAPDEIDAAGVTNEVDEAGASGETASDAAVPVPTDE